MNVTNLNSDTDFLCGTTSASYPAADKVRNYNVAYQNVARLIWESANEWQYDDSNATTLPIATATLVNNQQDYSLPSTIQRLERVEVKDASGNYQKLTKIDIHDITIGAPEFLETAGMPLYYDLIGSSLMLYPKPSSSSVTLASGLQVYVNRSVTEFATTATTTEPGFAVAFHRILSLAASIDFTQDKETRRFLVEQRDRLEKGLIRFYSKRNVEGRTRIKPFTKRRWRQYT